MAVKKKTSDDAAKAPKSSRSKKPVSGSVEAASAVTTAPQESTESAEERVRRRAYELSMTRSDGGSPEEDWLRAEEEVLGKRRA